MEMLRLSTGVLTDQGKLAAQLVIVLFVFIDECAAGIRGRIGLIQMKN